MTIERRTYLLWKGCETRLARQNSEGQLQANYLRYGWQVIQSWPTIPPMPVVDRVKAAYWAALS